MRTRKEIIEDKKKGAELGKLRVKDPMVGLMGPSVIIQSLTLEVLLDIRDILDRNTL